MRTGLIAAALLLICAFGANAQEQKGTETIEPGMGKPVSMPAAQKQTNVAHSIYRMVEVKPQPTFNQNEFLAQNLRYPEAAKEFKVEGRVTVEFVVERDGSLTNIKVIKGAEVGYGIPEEAIRVIKAMPKWKPAMLNGEVVRAYHNIPFSFKLQ